MIVTCAECGKKYQLPPEKIGVRFRCRQCGEIVETKDIDDSAAATTSPGEASAPDAGNSVRQHYIVCARGHIPLPMDRDFIFGRGLQCDYLLDDSRASRQHASLSWNGKEVVLRDMGSRNGTCHNGEPVRDSASLRDNDSFRIANESFVYRVVGSIEELQRSMTESRRMSRLKDTEELQSVSSMMSSNDFNGSLTTMNATEICQLLKLGRRTGRLFMMDGEHEKCTLYFDNGDIVGAEYGTRRGDEAVLSACRLRSGVFSFQATFRCNRPNVQKSTEFLLLEAARMNDEVKRR